MLINISKIKNGLTIKINNNYYKIISFLHVKPGKGNAFVRTKIKNLINGKINNKNFPSGFKINYIKLISIKYLFLYKTNENFIFINKENFSQIILSKNFIGNKKKFIKKNDTVIINFIKGKNKPLYLTIKKYVILKVIKDDIKVNNNSNKKSIVETGLSIYTPLFIKIGDYIKINTKTKKYIERIKL
ncbi:MAG: elongation factor P [Candidatus Shikimatogenerans bostrichidophilus]|nr:MAG: elongation factor P [Candidatus Shikimatogenerans bostrichidophilus]